MDSSTMLSTKEDVPYERGNKDVSRRLYGVDVPRMTKSAIALRFGIAVDDPVYQTCSGDHIWILPLVAETISALYIIYNGTRIFSITLDRLCLRLFSVQHWFDVFRNVAMEVSGQVKNFLVAVRTVCGLSGDSVRVLLRGSKAMSSSGIWQMSFAHWLARKFKRVTIDCYDLGEINGCEERIIDGCRVTIQRFQKWYPEDSFATEYDVCVDDAFDTIEKRVDEWRPQCKVWSKKRHNGGIPFLHVSESREFVGSKTFDKCRPMCPCSICLVCAKCVESYGEFLFLRAACCLYGGGRCSLGELPHDIEAKGSALRLLFSQPTVSVVTPEAVRSVIALMDDVTIAPVGLHEVMRVDKVEQPTVFVHKTGFSTLPRETLSYPWLHDRPVTFIGVPSSVLGSTRIAYGGVKVGQKKGGVVFAHSVEAALQQSVPDVLYVPRVVGNSKGLNREGNFVNHDIIPGYLKTGREIPPFVEYQRVVEDRDQSQAMFSYYSGVDVTKENDLSFTDVVPAVYKVTQEQLHQLEHERDVVVVAPTPGKHQRVIESYRLYEPRHILLKGKSFGEYMIEHVDDAHWDVLVSCTVPPERGELRKLLLRDGVWHVTEYHHGKCCFNEQGFSDCPDHLHMVRAICGNECREYYDNRLYWIIHDHGVDYMICGIVATFKQRLASLGIARASCGMTEVDDSNCSQYAGKMLLAH